MFGLPYCGTYPFGCGSKPSWYQLGVGAPPIVVYFSGDWDVHWDDLDFDPWPFECLARQSLDDPVRLSGRVASTEQPLSPLCRATQIFTPEPDVFRANVGELHMVFRGPLSKCHPKKQVLIGPPRKSNTYIYIYIIYTHTHIYIYIYIARVLRTRFFMCDLSMCLRVQG